MKMLWGVCVRRIMGVIKLRVTSRIPPAACFINEASTLDTRDTMKMNKRVLEPVKPETLCFHLRKITTLSLYIQTYSVHKVTNPVNHKQ